MYLFKTIFGVKEFFLAETEGWAPGEKNSQVNLTPTSIQIMCGIFGMITKEQQPDKLTFLRRIFGRLGILSESRGREACGVAALTKTDIYVYKEGISFSALVKTGQYKKIFDHVFAKELSVGYKTKDFMVSVSLLGHSRLVTNTREIRSNKNNQPIVVKRQIGFHNGIVVNADSLWKRFPKQKRELDVDSEIIFSLIGMFRRQGQSLVESVQSSFSLIEGAASIAVAFNDMDCLILATNNGSLYVGRCCQENVLFYASEQYILKSLFRERTFKRMLGDFEIRHVASRNGFLVNLRDLGMQAFALWPEKSLALSEPEKLFRNTVHLSPRENSSLTEDERRNPWKEAVPCDIVAGDTRNRKDIQRLKRCCRCILPETMPFIEFDESGLCNYCRAYQKWQLKGQDALENRISSFRKTSGGPDCLVGISGGRDSSFGLHYVKNILKMNPIAYTYDWGMVNDLARRNISRLCGKLGVEHILISADILRKRRFIQKNVLAWLKRPDLGTVPLFMAGDKQFFYYTEKLRKQTGVSLVFLSENIFEKTNFKSGFCGVKPELGNYEYISHLSLSKKLKMALYYGQEYFLNPSYMNSSMLDTLWAYACYYLIPHRFLNIYQYIQWDEKEIISTLTRDYNWERAQDTQSTWRIGDGTASLYNYIYYTVAGFSEHDTFHSNQIREGMITRQEALDLTDKENRPRYESIRWYCDTVGVDFERVLRVIQGIPKHYRSSIGNGFPPDD